MGAVSAANTDFEFEMTVTRVAQATRIADQTADGGASRGQPSQERTSDGAGGAGEEKHAGEASA